MINVYYGCWNDTEKETQYCEPPIPVIKTIVNSTGLTENSELFRCPALNDLIYNLYQVVATYDYTLFWDGEVIKSTDYNQKFFDSNVSLRNVKTGFFSYMDPPIYFFADCDSLTVSQLPVMFEKNRLDAIIIPGQYDMANHLRKIETALVLNKPNEPIKITAGMPLYYLKFNTKEKINFIRFKFTQELEELTMNLLKYRMYTKKITPLSWYYDTVRKYYKKKYLKIIKDNILE